MNNLIRMADMHNHILFGVDDGSPDLDTSIQMLDIAYQDGIRRVVLTPHKHPRRGDAPVAEIVEAYRQLAEAAKHRFPDMKLALGRELYYSSDLFDMLATRENLRGYTMGDSDTVLIEFSFSSRENSIREAVRNVIAAGFQPIVAHVERYACTGEYKTLVPELRRMGAEIQLNADSVIGNNGYAIKKVAKRLLKDDLVDYIATDAHDTESRSPVLSQCYKYVAKKYGEGYADEIMHVKPGNLV